MGLVIFGYGSCSGCDALEAYQPSHWSCEDGACTCDWTQVIELARSLQESIHWDISRADLGVWVTENPENYWWSYDDDIKSWLDFELDTDLTTKGTL